MQKILTTHRRSTGYVHHTLRYNKGERIKIKSGDQTNIVEIKPSPNAPSRFIAVVDARTFSGSSAPPKRKQTVNS